MIVKRPSFWLLILCLIVFSLLFLLKVKDEMIDFEVNYEAGQRIRQGETLYRAEDGHYQFKYSPFSSLFYIPLSYLPLDVAKGIWYFITLISTGFLLYISQRLLVSSAKEAWILPMLTFLILARYFLRELQLGQINTLIAFLLILMIWLLNREEKHSSSWGEKSAGLTWGLSMALKPYSLIFLPYFLIKKKWQALGFGLLFLALSLLIPSLFYGFRGNFVVLKEWQSSLSKSTPLLLDSQDNISIIALFMKWTANLKLSTYLYGFLLIVLAVFLLYIILKGSKTNQALLLDCAIILVLIPLVSPLGWDYNLLFSALGIMIILYSFNKYPKSWRAMLAANFLIIFFSLYSILGRKLYAGFMSLSIITINFTIVIAGLAYLRLKGHR
ncbi:MAG: DUF2029 domain-containing protein [Candidatus Aminicenantes bacterium]|nr:DUF2029 domain-containing protein [Candidatus Aminicenantes bacterium]